VEEAGAFSANANRTSRGWDGGFGMPPFDGKSPVYIGTGAESKVMDDIDAPKDSFSKIMHCSDFISCNS
jgi:hypothetical protein